MERLPYTTANTKKFYFLPTRIFCFLIFYQPHKWHILFCTYRTSHHEGKTKRATSPQRFIKFLTLKP